MCESNGVGGKLSGMKRFFVTGVLVLSFGVRAWAHSTPNSVVFLDFYRDAVAVELTLPMNELETAAGVPLLAAPQDAVARRGAALRDYVLARLHAAAPDGRPWTVEVRGMAAVLNQAQPDVDVRVWMQPPPGAPLRRFVLDYSVICREAPSHAALVSVRNDWNSAIFSGQPKLLGVVQYTAATLVVDRTHGSFWQGFGSVVGLGMRHIAGGGDHLLFLFVLLLPAPLRAAGGRWTTFRGLKGSVGQLLKIVTAFTVGHSLTLIAGGLGGLRLPGRPVEVLIAVSILVTAVHAMRPWFAGREVFVAGGFGLVHGLAFADSIAPFGFSPWHMAMTILGFNLGVELMQAALVLTAVPPLILLSGSRYYVMVRMTGAALAGGAALVWIGERVRW